MFRIAHRLVAAWSLLAVMALVVIPRGELHRCESQEASHPEHGEGATLSTGCPVCDAAAPVALGAEEQLRVVPVVLFASEHAEPARTVDCRCILRCVDRGPPALM